MVAGEVPNVEFTTTASGSRDSRWASTRWLDRLGLPMPDDIDQFHETMRAFKERDPNGNGEADETLVIFHWVDQFSLAHLLHPFGVILENGGWQAEDGAVTYSGPTLA